MRMPVRRLTVAFAVVLFAGMTAMVSAQDVYIVYSGKDRTLKQKVANAFPKTMKVKEYNVDLLALADYSGKQKAITKVSRADVVVIVGDKAMDILKRTKIKGHLLIVGTTKNDVKATEKKIHLVGHRTDVSKLSGSKLNVKQKSDLDDEDKVEDSKIVLVDEKGIELSEVTLIVAKILIG